MDSAYLAALNTAIDSVADSLVSMLTTNAPVVLGVSIAMVGLGFAVRLVHKAARG